jgi:alkylated DNA repair dioxygenase AlkB
MKIRGKAFHSTKFFLIADDQNDAQGRPAHYPKYSYPGFQWESLVNYKTISTLPSIQTIIKFFEDNITYTNTPDSAAPSSSAPPAAPSSSAPTAEEKSVKINHVLGTKYFSSEDHIAYHDDKAKYLLKDSPIFAISLGERREFHLRPKGSEDSTLYLVMEPGSLFVIGPKTNDTMQHSIVPTTDEKILKRTESVGMRISLTMRCVSVIVDREEVIKKIEETRITKEKCRIKAEEVKEKKKNKKNKKKIKMLKMEEDTKINKGKRKREEVEEEEQEEEDEDGLWKTKPEILLKGSGIIHRKECSAVKHSKLSWEKYMVVENESMDEFQKCGFCSK